MAKVSGFKIQVDVDKRERDEADVFYIQGKYMRFEPVANAWEVDISDELGWYKAPELVVHKSAKQRGWTVSERHLGLSIARLWSGTKEEVIEVAVARLREKGAANYWELVNKTAEELKAAYLLKEVMEEESDEKL